MWSSMLFEQWYQFCLVSNTVIFPIRPSEEKKKEKLVVKHENKSVKTGEIEFEE